jgi:hypothetical protein
MPHVSTPSELLLFNDITAHAASLWAKSRDVTGLNTDPKMFSIMLFKRLWSHHRGYIILWKEGRQTESDIILRACVETSICLAANYELRKKFVQLMHGDAIFTLKGQIKMWRELGNIGMVRESEALLRDIRSRFPADSKPARLNWERLAQQGRVPDLYGWHRQLSALVAHVTGVSVLSSIAPAEGPNPAEELGSLQRKMHFMMMAGATLQGCLRHGGMLDDEAACTETVTLLTRLSDLSWHWPGVTPPKTGDDPQLSGRI